MSRPGRAVQATSGRSGSIRAFVDGIAIAVSLLAAFVTFGCGNHPEYFRLNPEKNTARLAVMPLLNMSQYDRAEVVVTNALIVELLESELFEVVDPGLVETVVLEQRLRFTDRLPLGTLRKLAEQLNVEYLLLGSVNEFDFMSDQYGRLPCVSVSLRIVECNTGTIIWMATHSKRGDDAETVFGIGRVETLEQLTTITVREMARTLK